MSLKETNKFEPSVALNYPEYIAFSISKEFYTEQKFKRTLLNNSQCMPWK